MLGGILKSRPVFIIGIPDTGDYNVLPISKVSRRNRLNPKYDLLIDSTIYPELNLNAPLSYIRTHKQLVIPSSEINSYISDLKSSYIDLFLLILERVEEYNKSLIDNALLC